MCALLSAEVVDESALTPKLEFLKAEGVDIPTSTKHKLLALRLRSFVPGILEKQQDEAMVGLIDVLNPFEVGHNRSLTDANADAADQPQEVIFDPLHPRMCHLEGSLLSKLIIAKRVFIHDLMRPLVDGGETSSSALLLLAKRMTAMYEEALEEIDEVPTPMEEMLCVCRTLESLLDVTTEQTNDREVERLSASSTTKSGASSCAIDDAALLLRGSDYYNQLLSNYMAFLGSAKVALPQVHVIMDALQVTPPGDPGLPDIVERALGDIPRWRTSLRLGGTYKVESMCQDRIEKHCKEVLKLAAAPDVGENMSKIMACKSMCKKAVQVWPSSTELSESLASLDKAASAHDQTKRVRKLVDAMSKHMEAKLKYCKEHLVEVKAALADCAGLRIVAAEDLQPATEFFSQAVVEAFTQADGGQEQVDFLQNLADLLPDTIGEESIADGLRLLQAAFDLREACAAFNVLGYDMGSRHAQDPNFKVIMTIIQKIAVVHKIADQAHFDAKFDGSAYEGLLANACLIVRECGRTAVDEAKDILNAEVASTAGWRKGGEDGREWWESLPDKPSLQMVLEKAKVTVMATACKDYKEAAQRIQLVQSKYEDITGIFSLESETQVIDAAFQARLECMKSCFEGLLCQLFSTECDPLDLKRKVKGIKTNMGEQVPQVPWDSLQSELKVRAAAALKLR